MQAAIEALNIENIRIVLVVDHEKRLIGTITDGDVRRALIKHLSLETELHEFMFSEPTVARQDETKDEILSKMEGQELLQIPILDNERRIVGVETLRDLTLKRRNDNPVFLMAGGFGKRLRPLTDNIPKPLLKIGSKPILETILEQFVAAGFHRFYISTHYKAEMIQEYFKDGSHWGVTIEYVYEKEPLGTAGAIALLPKDLPDIPIIVMNGDIFTNINFEQLLGFHCKQGGDATMCVREYDFQVPYGVIQAQDHRITTITEKPIHRFFINAGIYILGSHLIKSIGEATYIDMPYFLERVIENSGQVSMFPIHEYWLDIGQLKDYEEAQIFNDNLGAGRN